MLDFWNAVDQLDENHHMGESTGVENLGWSFDPVVDFFTDEHLSPPNTEQTKLLLKRGNGWAFRATSAEVIAASGSGKISPPLTMFNIKMKEGFPSITLEAISEDLLYILACIFGHAGV